MGQMTLDEMGRNIVDAMGQKTVDEMGFRWNGTKNCIDKTGQKIRRSGI